MASAPIENDDQIVDTGDVEAGEPAQLTEVEQLAQEMGWDPNHKGGNGKPPRTAREWIASTNRHNKNLQREVDGLRTSIDRIVDATDKQVKREVESRIREIEQRFEAAVDAQDKAGAAKAAQDMRDLESEQQAASAPRGESAEDKFARENTWYGNDEEATAYAVAQSQLQAKKGITDPDKQLANVAAAVRKRFPELFDDGQGEQDQREKPKTPLLNAPSRSAGGRKTTGFADMPEAARLAANRFYEAAKMRGSAPDRKAYEAQYAKDYFADQAA